MEGAARKLDRWVSRGKSRALPALQLLRRPTSRLRRLPDFLVVGTMRGGTTSLYHYLLGHPEIRRPLHKEVGYFGRNHERGLAWYRSNFPLGPLRPGAPAGSARRQSGPHARLTFEASPAYLFDPAAAQRAARTVPEARIIALLRDPVERAFSHYRLMVSQGWERLPFAEAVELEPRRLEGVSTHDPRAEGNPVLARELYSYLARGRYVEQVPRWTEAFGPERVLILRSEDLYTDPSATFAQVLEFLGLSAWRPPHFAARSFTMTHEAGGLALDPLTRKNLAEYFAPYNAALYEFIGRDMAWPA